MAEVREEWVGEVRYGGGLSVGGVGGEGGEGEGGEGGGGVSEGGGSGEWGR